MFNKIFSYVLISEAQQRTFPAKVASIVWFSVFASIIVIFFFVCFVFNKQIFSNRKKKEKLDFNVRMFTFNYATQTFYRFDKSNLSNTKELTYDEFFSQFSKSDKYLVEDWLRNIAHNEAHLDYLQADIVLSKKRKIASTMLELTSVNRQKNIIHFVSHLLPNTYSFNLKSNGTQKIKTPTKFILATIETAQKFIEKHSDDAIGALYYFKIYKKTNPDVVDEETEEMNKKVRLVLGKFLSKQRKIIYLSPYEETMIDTTSISKISAMNFATTLHTQIQQLLNHTENGDRYAIAIGISNGAYYEKNYPLGKEQAMKMANAIIKGLTKDKVLFYDETFFTNYQLSKAQKDEIRMVVKNSTFRNFFIPTLSISDGKTPFYLLVSYPYGTSVDSFYSAAQIAKEMNITGELFDDLMQKVGLMTKNLKKKITIAKRLPYNSISEFIKSAERSHLTNVSWIITVEETDLLTSGEDSNAIAKLFHDYSKYGYKFGLILENPSSSLRTRILRTISYFFIPPSFTSQSKDINRSKTTLRSFQATYGNYHIPMVYYGLEDLEDVELGVHYGGTIFQSDALSLPSSHVEEISSETIKKVLDEARSLVPKN